MLFRFLVLGILGPLALLAAGCGGSGDDDDSPPGAPRLQVTVDWGARSRGVAAPGSALSAVLTLRGAGLSDNGDVSFTVNRDLTRLEAHSQIYTSPVAVKLGTFLLEVRFHALPFGEGAVVGSAQALVPVVAGGLVGETLAVNKTITAVELPPGQSVQVGERKDLAVTPRDAAGGIVAVTPGSVFLEVIAGGDRLRVVEGGRLEGAAPGAATVRAVVDGVASPPVIIPVLSETGVSIVPAGVTISVRGTQIFRADVANAPDPSVVWSVAEGAAGGTITPEGVYTAPNAPGVYHVVAASRYDPSRSAVATVVVVAGDVPVIVPFPESGDVPVVVPFPDTGDVPIIVE